LSEIIHEAEDVDPMESGTEDEEKACITEQRHENSATSTIVQELRSEEKRKRAPRKVGGLRGKEFRRGLPSYQNTAICFNSSENKLQEGKKRTAWANLSWAKKTSGNPRKL